MNPAARIIDANFNRAREALRVMEDAARFGLDDADLSAALKGLRHDLRSAMEREGFDAGVRLAARDTPGDVGTVISTESERTRTSLRDVAHAAGARLGEALRTIEECVKSLGHDAAGIEQLRYRAYTLEQDVALAFGTGRAVQWTLCVVLMEALCTHHPWEEVARQAIAGGADCLQLREKSLDGRELLDRARRLVRIARDMRTSPQDARGKRRPEGVAVVINDRPDIALLAEADGVHIGQTDLPVREVRRLVGFDLLIGVSTANMDQARAAVRDGADYCGVGPMFRSSTKEKPAISGPAYLREYLADPVTAGRPHLAISGITPENIGELAAAGCRGVAASSAVCSPRDPEAACRALVQSLVPRDR